MPDKKYARTLVTCALPYANGPVHIGHLAGVYVPGDIYVRYLRLRGEDVLYICGSDEHGVPITLKARKEGVTPQDIVDRYHKIIKDSFSSLGINFDIYSRTTSPVHQANASAFFSKLEQEGKFVTMTSNQYYDETEQVFLADRYIQGTCPRCGNPNAYGDQCEKCGSTLSPEELINPRSAVNGAPLTKRDTTHWYLPLDKYEPWLREWILEGHKEWKVNVYGQCKSWLDGGLQPRAVSRDLNWGVPVPVEGAKGKVLYVWFDAPIGYISNSQELLPQSWEKWWKSEDTRLVHFIGKDNIVFHCIVFPSMLKADGTYILPDNVPANEFLNLEGDKISTSRNWAVWLDEYVRQFPGQEDVLRYIMCANAPETKDNDFTWKDFQQRNNSELVAIFGNFVNRAVVLTGKYFGSKVPANLKPEPIDTQTLESIVPVRKALEDYLDTFHFREALKEAMNIARIGNKYISDTTPWAVAKTDIDRCASILYTSLQICADLAIAFEPFLPFSAAKLRDILEVGIDAGTDHRAGEGEPTVNFYKPGEGSAIHTVHSDKDIILHWDDLGKTCILPSGHVLGEPVLLFSKIEDSVVDAQMKKLQDIKTANEAKAMAEAAKAAAARVEPQKEQVTFDDFSRMDIRVAKVLEATKVPKSDKLLKLTIDTGIDTRTIVSGIAQHYTPEQMVGREICILANLAPRKIFGIESQGMILMAKQGDGTMKVVAPEDFVTPGSVVG